MADIVISGNTSGAVTLRAPDISGTTLLTLPTSSGTLVVTGGAQTVQFAAGSAASPSITFTGDTNTGIFSPAADTIAFTEGGVESMRIDSSGNVGIGLTSYTGKLAVNGVIATYASTDNNYRGSMDVENGNLRFIAPPFASNPTNMVFHTGSGSTERMRIEAGGSVLPGADGAQALGSSSRRWLSVNAVTFTEGGASTNFITTSGTSTLFNSGSTWQQALFYTAGGERMRITSAGNLLVATTSFTNPYPSAYTAPGIGLGTKTPITWNSTNGAIWGGGGGVDDRLYAAAGNGVIIYSNTNLNVGVQLTGGANSWSSVSDESLKTDLTPIQNATEKVFSLRAVTGRYKTDEETVSRAFLIAQDVQKVLPEAVSEDEETGILNLRYTETIPLLVAAIQEQQTMIHELKARIDVLEGAK